VKSTSPLDLVPLSARSAQRTHYLDLIQIYTGLGDEEIDLILMHLPRTRESAAQDDRNANVNGNIN
jgi:hypothetical protein